MRLHALSHGYRSALDDFPAPHSLPSEPRVSLIVPVYNEIASLRQLVADIVGQDYPVICEIWFVDGQSRDGSLEALKTIQASDRRVRVISNPKRLPAAAINRALELATGDIVVRLDAHARYENDFVRQSVQALLLTGAGGVGAIARPAKSHTLTGRAIVAAHNSPLGVGVAKFRKEGAEGWTDTVWNGCYWKYIVDRVGRLREDLHRAEDNDFNARVRKLGYGLYLSPKMRASYQPRQTLLALWTQYFGNGLGVARALFESPRSIRPRHLAPPALVVALILSGAAAWIWPAIVPAAIGVPVFYLAVLLTGTILAARTERGAYVLMVPAALATLHLSYGFGTLLGIAQLLGEQLRRNPPTQTAG